MRLTFGFRQRFFILSFFSEFSTKNRPVEGGDKGKWFHREFI